MLKKEGYKDSQVAEQMGISRRTVRRMLAINPEHMCVDGTQTRKSRKILDPHRKQIEELIERGFQTSQILKKLQEMFPGINIKRTTLSDYCVKLRDELYTMAQLPEEYPQDLSEDSILSPHMDKIRMMLSENKMITVIYAAIVEDGYIGSYSLLQQFCVCIKPKTYRIKKSVHKIKRRELVTAVWSDKTNLTKPDIEYIQEKYPIICEIQDIITEFRTAFSNKDIESVKLWCEKYAQSQFQAIRSFINGINLDADAFYNSMKYEYSNALLEGSVNKLKEIKRSMYGRAGYPLLRAKLLLSNGR